jgi:hypothetical protein
MAMSVLEAVELSPHATPPVGTSVEVDDVDAAECVSLVASREHRRAPMPIQRSEAKTPVMQKA